MTEYFLQICTAKPCVVDEVEEGSFKQLNNSQRSLDPHQWHFGKHHRALVDCVHRHIVCRHVAQVVVECLLCWRRQYRPQIVHICAREWCNNSYLLTYLHQTNLLTSPYKFRFEWRLHVVHATSSKAAVHLDGLFALLLLQLMPTTLLVSLAIHSSDSTLRQILPETSQRLV